MISTILVVYKPKEKLLKKFLKRISSKNFLIIVNINYYNLKNFHLIKITKIINTENNGYGSAINLALKNCKTKYAFISQIDADLKIIF